MTLWKVLVMHYPIVEHHGAASGVIRSCHSLLQEPIKQHLSVVQTRNCVGLTSSMCCSKICLALNSWLAGRLHFALPESRVVTQRRIKHAANTAHERLTSGSWPIIGHYFNGLTLAKEAALDTQAVALLKQPEYELLK
ncbi:hypothetical protein LQF05_12865 [Stutzerimonas stutzeri]|uniref:hypothetical protein n=1 Tax=Stutzerimonas stutzeri TaxID=316 RepID=UPI0022DDB005|nr:hypothetical protein [Stutzerimonas stutzeri]WBL58830.1 hypothetical protein LQF05_12865 [Stutzerimonas stutzeri]